MSGKYIVVFKPEVSKDEIDKYIRQVTDGGGSVSQEYDSVLKGFSATIPDQVLASLQSLQGGIIDYIEPDGVVTTQS